MNKSILSLIVAAMALVTMTTGVTSQLLAADIYRGGLKDGPPPSSSVSVYPVESAPAIKWTGLWAGVGLGYGFVDNQITADIEGQNFFDFQGIGGQGLAYDGELGYDVRIPGVNFLVGVVAGYGGSEIESSLDVGGGAFEATYEHGTTWWVGGRAGPVLANDRLLIYGKLVYAQNDPEDLRFTGGSFNLDTREGIGYGGGVEGALGGGLFFGVEGMYFDFEEKTLFAGDEFAIKEDLDEFEVKARLKYKLGASNQPSLF